MRAKFNGGPLEGREFEMPGEHPALEVHVSRSAPADLHGELVMAAGFTRYLIGDPPRTRYSLLHQRGGVAHYYIPTSES